MGKAAKKAAWLLPCLLEGSGGHRTVLQHVKLMSDRGWDCTVYVEPGGSYDDTDVEAVITRWFGPCGARIKSGFQVAEDYDIMFATVWYSAAHVLDSDRAEGKAYFIQDFEACFNPMGDGWLMAENSYRYDLMPVTIGRWLTHRLAHEYGREGRYFDFCADLETYSPQRGGAKASGEQAVCFIYQPEKPRRCALMGLEALGIVKKLRPGVKIFLYGSGDLQHHVGFEHEHLGLLPLPKLNELYNSCTAGLCISSSNPSRIPFEMMASGLPVVDIHRENNLYDMPEDGVLLARPDRESLAQAILNILDDDAMQKRMGNAGAEFMRERPLEKGFEQFHEALESMVSDSYTGMVPSGVMYAREPVVGDAKLRKMPCFCGVKEPVSKRAADGLYGLSCRMKGAVKRLVGCSG